MGYSKKSSASMIEEAEITKVRPENFSVDVMTKHSHRAITDLRVAAQYVNSSTGSGGNFMPEEGADCYVFSPANGRPFVMGFIVKGETNDSYQNIDGNNLDIFDSDTGPSYAGVRKPHNRGDLSFSTKDGNFVSIKRGGIVQIYSTSLCQTMYIPIENLIHSFYMKKIEQSPIGDVEWDHTEIKEDSDSTFAIIKFNVKNKLEDAFNAVEVRVGNLTDKILDSKSDSKHFTGKKAKNKSTSFADGRFSIVVSDDSGNEAFMFQIDNSGSSFIKANTFHMEALNYYAKAADNYKIETNNFNLESFIEAKIQSALITLISSGDIKLSGSKLILDFGEIVMKAGSVNVNSGNIRLGNSSIPIAVNAVQLQAFLAGVFASLTTLGVPPGPPPNVVSITTKGN